MKKEIRNILSGSLAAIICTASFVSMPLNQTDAKSVSATSVKVLATCSAQPKAHIPSTSISPYSTTQSITHSVSILRSSPHVTGYYPYSPIPYISEAPVHSDYPIATRIPDYTFQPIRTEAPDITEIPDITDSPVISMQPDVSSSPSPVATVGVPKLLTANDISFSYDTLFHWNNELMTKLVIKNLTNRTYYGWTLSFNTNSQFTQVMGAKLLSQNGSLVTLASNNWSDVNEPALKPNETIEIGITAKGTDTTISNFTMLGY